MISSELVSPPFAFSYSASGSYISYSLLLSIPPSFKPPLQYSLLASSPECVRSTRFVLLDDDYSHNEYFPPLYSHHDDPTPNARLPPSLEPIPFERQWSRNLPTLPRRWSRNYRLPRTTSDLPSLHGDRFLTPFEQPSDTRVPHF
jgi:hypothetical protein